MTDSINRVDLLLAVAGLSNEANKNEILRVIYDFPAEKKMPIVWCVKKNKPCVVDYDDWCKIQNVVNYPVPCEAYEKSKYWRDCSISICIFAADILR